MEAEGVRLLTLHTQSVYTSVMNNTLLHTRINISLPRETLSLLDRVTAKGDRSSFLSRAVHYYIAGVGRDNLKEQIRHGAIAHASRDKVIAEEWFSVDEHSWQKQGKR